MKTKLSKRFDYERPVPLSFEGDSGRSRTKQSFKAEADINNIMLRYQKTGLLVDPSTVNTARKPSYGDFSDGSDFQSVVDRITAVRGNFAALPSDIRDMFGNDPSVMLDFMADPENLEDCYELGLIDRPAAAVEPPPAPETAPEPVSPVPSPEPEEGS